MMKYILALGGCFLPMAALADDVCQMEFRLCTGTTCHTYELVGDASQFGMCIFQGPLVISEWMRENAKEGWQLHSWKCYKGTLQAKM